MAKASAKPGTTIDFEAALDQLEELVDDMEHGDLSLEQSLKAFEQGIKLTRDCQSALSQAEQSVQTLIAENAQLKNNSVAPGLDDDDSGV